MDKIRFNIECWQALSPGLMSVDDWKTWAAQGQCWPETVVAVPTPDIPAMLRRRMSSLSKLAVQTAIELSKDNNIDFIIFSSRHGEIQRTSKLLMDILQGKDGSPTIFSQSVHNTAAGLFTIAAKHEIASVAIAAGEHSLHSAMIEAYSYLSDNPNHRVLLVDCDDPLPVPYDQYDSKTYQRVALGMILSAGEQYTLRWQAKNRVDANTFNHPQTLDVIANLACDHSSWKVTGQRMDWYWNC